MWKVCNVVKWFCSCTVRSESHCALRLRYVDLVVSIEVAVEVCCCCVTFHCIQLLYWRITKNEFIPVDGLQVLFKRKLLIFSIFLMSWCQLLNEFFGERGISRNLWPSRSPDLTPPDFYLWGAAKSAVYRDHPRTLKADSHIACRVHAVPQPCRAVNSHMPCRAPALLRQFRVHCESPRGSRKYPNC